MNDLARPHVTKRDLPEAYRAMAADEKREREAAEWVENLPGDIADDPSPDRLPPPQRGEGLVATAFDPRRSGAGTRI